MADDGQKQILLIEDDPHIPKMLEIHFRDLGYQLHHELDGAEGLREALDSDYDLVILDIMLPGMDGLEVCRRLRAEKKSLPVLMLTARVEELDRVLGLETGADDYLTKPFSIRELLARIKAILRRVEVVREAAQNNARQAPLHYGPLEIDLHRHRVALDGANVDLTTKEFDLLALFASNPGRAYSRQQLLDLVWGYQYSGYEYTVNSHINRLRGKIESDPANPVFVETVWGFGYRFTDRKDFSA